MFVVSMRLLGGVHVGEPVGIERQRVLTYIPSDTIFAALMTAWAQAGRGEEMVGRFQAPGPPPFILTSAFPCLLEDVDGAPRATLRFYPRPLVQVNALPERLDRVGKKLKATWVSERLFLRLCRGEDVGDACTPECFAPGGLWLDPADRCQLPAHLLDSQGHIRPLWVAEDVPHVVLDRISGAGSLYHVGRVVFAADVGLWWGLRAEQAWAADIQQALTALSGTGLGGFRSIGCGAFSWGWSEEEEDVPGGQSYAVTLARYAPRREEIGRALKSPASAYGLVSVGGWCTDDYGRTWRRRWVRMVAEGSVIGCNGGYAGHLVPVTPLKPSEWDEGASPWPFSEKRPVYRWGYAFPVPVAAAALPQEVGHA